MITLTRSAILAARQKLVDRGSGIGIKIGIKATGCSGYSYVLEFVDESRVNDEQLQCEDIQIFVDSDHISALRGTTVDYVREGLNSGFKFSNPNARSHCGCGESFRI